MIKIATYIDLDDLKELVAERLHYWDEADGDAIQLYTDYFEGLADGGVLDNLPEGLEHTIDSIIVNNTRVIEEGDDSFLEELEEFKNSGVGGRILATNDECNPTALLIDYTQKFSKN